MHSGGDATLDPSPSVDGTRDRETDESTEPRSRSSSSPALLTDGASGSHSSSATESSTESAHELGKPTSILI